MGCIWRGCMEEVHWRDPPGETAQAPPGAQVKPSEVDSSPSRVQVKPSEVESSPKFKSKSSPSQVQVKYVSTSSDPPIDPPKCLRTGLTQVHSS